MDKYLINSDTFPFGAKVLIKPHKRLLLLPTPRVTIVKCANTISLLGPHSSLKVIQNPDWVVSVRPEAVKLLFGKVEDFVNKLYQDSELATLGAFLTCSTTQDIKELLLDGRNSVTKIWDEELFVSWWRAGMEVNAIDRSLQRACKRYGGQSPQQIQIQMQYKMGLSLIDYVYGGDIYKDFFSDQSHFIRACKLKTGKTPNDIKNMSDFFYLFAKETD